MITWVFIRSFGETKVLKESEYFPAGTHRNYKLVYRGSLPECSIECIKYRLKLITSYSWNYPHLTSEEDKKQALANDRKYLQRKLSRILERNPEYAI